jgi:isopentenyldiphosphate isomerase
MTVSPPTAVSVELNSYALMGLKIANVFLTSIPHDFEFSSLYQLLLPNDARPHGFMQPSIVSQMPWSSEFVVNHTSRTVQVLDSSDGKDTAKACITAFQTIIDAAIDASIFPLLHGQHSEMYPIIGANQFVYLERYTTPLFGIAGRGAHMTAYVRSPSGLKIWVPRRSAHLFTYPGMLDTSVAGGVKADHSPFDCIAAEGHEEASLPADFVQQNAQAVGIVTYVSKSRRSGLIKPNVLYMFDIELPETMVLKPNDDEVSDFYLWSVEEVRQAMLRQEFKPNCTLVMMDFFIRHGIITQENERDYVEIATRLRRRLPVPMMPEH